MSSMSPYPAYNPSGVGGFAHDGADLQGSENSPMIRSNTPAMPLTEAHFGGFFVSGGCR